jgi:hypothetical protein
VSSIAGLTTNWWGEQASTSKWSCIPRKQQLLLPPGPFLHGQLPLIYSLTKLFNHCFLAVYSQQLLNSRQKTVTAGCPAVSQVEAAYADGIVNET